MVGKQKVVTDAQSERQAARDKIKEELDRCVEGGCCTSKCLACFHLSTLAHNSFCLGFLCATAIRVPLRQVSKP